MRIVLITFCCIAFLRINAQYKTMFPVDSITWEIYLTNSDNNFFSQLKYNGDTIHLENKVYHSIVDYFGFDDFLIREDTTKGKTWFRRNKFNFEVLIMDLDLQENDSIANNYGSFRSSFDEKYVKVEKIGIVGERKVIEFNLTDRIFGVSVPMKYIEGIGCTFGFPHYEYDMICKIFHNEKLVYVMDFTKQFSCPIPPLGLSLLNIHEHVEFYPNPTSSLLQIYLKDVALINSKINLFNIEGKLVYQTKLNSTETKIDLSSFQPQMLIIDIEKEDVHYISKILKQ